MKEISPLPVMNIQEAPAFADPDSAFLIGSVFPPVDPETGEEVPSVIQPAQPCLFCDSNQWFSGAIRFLNGSAGYNPLRVFMDGVLVNSSLSPAAVTSYRQVAQGYHTFTVSDTGQNVTFSKSLYVGDGMATIAVTNSGSGLNLLSVPDTSCPTSSANGCLRVCNLAFYSRNVNVTVGNVAFQSTGFGQVSSFSSFRSGNYNVRVARTANPSSALLNTSVSLRANRIHTLYILNWNQSPDAIQILLVTDRRG